MNNFHGGGKKNSFFEGWYLKHQNGVESIAFIPAYHIDKNGTPSASLQIITNDNSYTINYKESDFQASKNKFRVRLKNSFFSDKGVYISIDNNEVKIKGKLTYLPFKPIKYDIMGPFALVPFMQCNHGVLSMYHKIMGTLNVNGKNICFTGGIGYIEKDWGTSFPSSYVWTHCGFDKEKCSIMASVADIPFMKTKFKGTICSIIYDDKEFRLATYSGARIIKFTDKEIIIKQGKHILEITLLEAMPIKLNAPNCGDMTRTVFESLSCNVRYRFYENSEILFELTGNNASFEASI